jgi:hypothetical protein
MSSCSWLIVVNKRRTFARNDNNFSICVTHAVNRKGAVVIPVAQASPLWIKRNTIALKIPAAQLVILYTAAFLLARPIRAPTHHAACHTAPAADAARCADACGEALGSCSPGGGAGRRACHVRTRTDIPRVRPVRRGLPVRSRLAGARVCAAAAGPWERRRPAGIPARFPGHAAAGLSFPRSTGFVTPSHDCLALPAPVHLANCGRCARARIAASACQCPDAGHAP